jgi:hypothetical protein
VNGGGVPYLQVDATITGNTEIVNTVTYRDSMRDNVFQVGLLDPQRSNASLNVFPNPTSNLLFISADIPSGTETVIRIVDVAGRVLVGQEYPQLANSIIPVDCGQLAVGMYFIQIVEGNQILATSRFIRN